MARQVTDHLRCSKCGRRVGIYLNEVSGRYIAHRIPIAFHKAVVEGLTLGKPWWDLSS